MRRRIFMATVVALVIGLFVMAVPAFARGPVWSPFGNGHWVQGVGNPGAGLVTTSVQTTSTITYGGIQLRKPFTPTNPSSITALSFDFNANQTGNSGGSPRMVVVFSDGGNGDLRPLTWTANTWTHMDGMTGTNWDNSGGSCGSLYETTWTAIMACHAGATITSIFVVNDSGWLYPSTGEQVILDNITVNNHVATGPSGN